MNKALFAALASGIVFTAFADSILKDGDMSGSNEKACHFGAWYYDPRLKDGFQVSYDTADFVSKPQSLKISSEGKTIAIRQDIQLVPGKKYRIRFYMKTKNLEKKSESAGAVLNICDGINRWFPSKWILGSTEWTKYEGTFTAGKKAEKGAYILLYLWGASGTVWFDDVILEEVK